MSGNGFPATGDLGDQIGWLVREIGEMKRRNRNRVRTGKIAEVDLEKGLARVELRETDGEKYLSPWRPWKEVASGGIKSHIPPTVGEQVDLVSENGDLTDAVIDMSTPSDENQRPHDGPEAVITHGDTRITIADGRVTIDADRIEFNGSSVKHNGVEIGDKHEHTDVEAGADLTGPPAE